MKKLFFVLLFVIPFSLYSYTYVYNGEGFYNPLTGESLCKGDTISTTLPKIIDPYVIIITDSSISYFYDTINHNNDLILISYGKYDSIQYDTSYSLKTNSGEYDTIIFNDMNNKVFDISILPNYFIEIWHDDTSHSFGHINKKYYLLNSIDNKYYITNQNTDQLNDWPIPINKLIIKTIRDNTNISFHITYKKPREQ